MKERKARLGSLSVGFVRHHLVLLIILFTAAVLRLSWLGTIPAGLSWDEAAIGYNGFGISTVHRDEWLERMPITFKSFGDYKAAVAIYADAISTRVLGVNTFAIRFPMAIAGIFTVFMTYIITLELTQQRSAARIAAVLVAVSPLNIQFSRIAFESGIGVACTAGGVACFLRARKKGWYLLGSAAFFVLSMYAYHSTKIAVPLLVVLMAIVYWNEFKKSVFWVGLSAIVGLVLVIPLVRETMYGNAGERFYMTSAIVTQSGLLPFPQLMSTLVSNTTAHLLPSFLLFGQTQTYRHGTGSFGILSYLEFVLLIVGIFSLVQQKHAHRWLLLALVIGLIPAIISNDVPHSNRAHGIIPWIQIVAAYGYLQCTEWVELHAKKNRTMEYISRYLSFFIISALVIQTAFYSFLYARIFTTLPAIKDFQYGYEQAVMYSRQKESEVDKVLFTNAYSQAYIYIILYKQLTPIQFQQGALANYEIRDLKWDQDKSRKNLLIVGTPQEIPADAPHIVKEILYPGGEVAFRIVQQ